LEESILVANRIGSNLIVNQFNSNPGIIGGITKLSKYLKPIDFIEIESQDIPCGQGYNRAANNSCK
jgi:hypothetical protein